MTSPADYLKQISPDRSVADILAEVFRKRIIEGEYLPGMRLVEAEISKVFGVSRGSVREAFRRLIAEGMLEAEKHKSPVVRGVGETQFRQMFEVRAVLEGFGAQLAARNSKQPAHRKWLEEELKVWRAGKFESHGAFVAANTEFHNGIEALAEHSVLTDQIAKLAIPGYKSVFRAVVTPADVTISSQQHSGILEAILESDEELARTRMVEHVLDTRDRVADNFNSDLFDRRLRELERLRADAEA
jgi:DNA-binding GntR family transcriptional regulator